MDSSPTDPRMPAQGAEAPAAAGPVTPEERERAISRLSDAFARDILPVDEFERRVSAVYDARTPAVLEALTGDLPAPRAPAPASPRPLTPQDSMASRVTAVFASVERAGRLAVPARLEIRATFGNVELDLREARFGDGVTEIGVRALFGNVEVRLPPDVAVENHGRALLGSFAARATPRGPGNGPTVRITGTAVLGNVEFEGAAPGTRAIAGPEE